jgi:hypothetical protein
MSERRSRIFVAGRILNRRLEGQELFSGSFDLLFVNAGWGVESGTALRAVTVAGRISNRRLEGQELFS